MEATYILLSVIIALLLLISYKTFNTDSKYNFTENLINSDDSEDNPEIRNKLINDYNDVNNDNFTAPSTMPDDGLNYVYNPNSQVYLIAYDNLNFGLPYHRWLYYH